MLPIPYFDRRKVVSLFGVLFYIGLTLVGLWLLYGLRNLIPPFLVATIIAMTLRPEVDRMERRGRLLGVKITRGIAIGVIYMLFLVLSGLILMILVPQVGGQMTDIITKLIPSELRGTATDVTRWVTHRPYWPHIPPMIKPSLLNQAQHLPSLIDKGMQWFGDNLPALAGNLIWVVIVPILAFFILLDFYKILGKILMLVRADRREGIMTLATEVSAIFGNYIRGILLVMGLDIVVISVVLWGAGLHDYAITLAVTAGILYTIPYFGALVSTIGIGLTMLATHGLVPALVVTGIMIFIHQIVFDNIVAPRIIGGSVSLHPLLALIALMAGGTLFGIGGTLLAVPLAAAAQVVLVHLFPQLKADVVARRIEPVVKTTLDKRDEEEKPELRKSGAQHDLNIDAENAREASQTPPPVLPPA